MLGQNAYFLLYGKFPFLSLLTFVKIISPGLEISRSNPMTFHIFHDPMNPGNIMLLTLLNNNYCMQVLRVYITFSLINIMWWYQSDINQRQIIWHITQHSSKYVSLIMIAKIRLPKLGVVNLECGDIFLLPYNLWLEVKLGFFRNETTSMFLWMMVTCLQNELGIKLMKGGACTRGPVCESASNPCGL